MRSINNLKEYDIKPSDDYTILTGVWHRDAIEFKDKDGNPVNVPDCYILHRLTNQHLEKGVYGSLSKEIKLSVLDFERIFESEILFLDEWAWKPVNLQFETDPRDQKLVLYGIMPDNRYDAV